MDVENTRRNLRDFLSMYNHFTETCFERCVQNLNYRVLTPQEELCTNKCITKLINVNHRQIGVYMEINPLNRRLNELSNQAQSPEEVKTPPPDLAQEVAKALGKDGEETVVGQNTGTNSPELSSSSSGNDLSNKGAAGGTDTAAATPSAPAPQTESLGKET